MTLHRYWDPAALRNALARRLRPCCGPSAAAVCSVAHSTAAPFLLGQSPYRRRMCLRRSRSAGSARRMGDPLGLGPPSSGRIINRCPGRFGVLMHSVGFVSDGDKLDGASWRRALALCVYLRASRPASMSSQRSSCSIMSVNQVLMHRRSSKIHRSRRRAGYCRHPQDEPRTLIPPAGQCIWTRKEAAESETLGCRMRQRSRGSTGIAMNRQQCVCRIRI